VNESKRALGRACGTPIRMQTRVGGQYLRQQPSLGRRSPKDLEDRANRGIDHSVSSDEKDEDWLRVEIVSAWAASLARRYFGHEPRRVRRGEGAPRAGAPTRPSIRAATRSVKRLCHSISPSPESRYSALHGSVEWSANHNKTKAWQRALTLDSGAVAGVRYAAHCGLKSDIGACRRRASTGP
jgi:hypothetical protein